MTITRFSPSPTGYLHIGNARTLLTNYLYSKANSGQFYVRIDDTDFKRSKDEYTRAIVEDIKWLGIEYDKFFKQSDRLDVYEEAKARLIADGRLYPCFETEDELQLKRKIQLSRKVPPIYDRSSLKLTKEEIGAKLASGMAPHYRFKLNDEEIAWRDRIRGDILFKARAFSDPILVREDKSPTYTFCSVVDDIDYNITDIIRGEDHITNTAIQIQIFRALGGKIPRFTHLSLLKGKEGEISKRFGGHEIRSLRAQGIDKNTVNSYLAKIGTSHNVVPEITLDKLSENFQFKYFAHSAVIYNEEDLSRLNRKTLVKYDFAAIKAKAAEFDITELEEDVYEIIKDNLDNILDIIKWSGAINNPEDIEFSAEDREYLGICAKLMPDDLSEGFYEQWMSAIKQNSGRKGRELFNPIRLSLTGYDFGPELKKIIPYLGMPETISRINKYAK
ncbi:MAG: glutamate--tRNA ligase [Rickettsiales bacterium]|jgi:glutamyl-tRNA synthetase|nr:glutamate--tRNA ligase [Rickettsiales bacterium]